MAVHHGVLYTSQDRKSTESKRYSECICGVYDHTDDTMFTHCYKNKTSDQFIDFIKRIDSRYDSKIKTIFVILDNAHPYIGQKRQ
jgi:DDE superfamily endonuclease